MFTTQRSWEPIAQSRFPHGTEFCNSEIRFSLHNDPGNRSLSLGFPTEPKFAIQKFDVHYTTILGTDRSVLVSPQNRNLQFTHSIFTTQRSWEPIAQSRFPHKAEICTSETRCSLRNDPVNRSLSLGFPTEPQFALQKLHFHYTTILGTDRSVSVTQKILPKYLVLL